MMKPVTSLPAILVSVLMITPIMGAIAQEDVTVKPAVAMTDGTWAMHDVESLETTTTSYGPVGSIFVDVDGDGLGDFLSAFEEGGVRIDFNPGPKAVTKIWPFTMIPPALTDVDGEGLCAGNVDGDGAMDIVVTMGSNNGNPNVPIHCDHRQHVGELVVLWGPGGKRSRDAAAWTSSVLPASINAGNFCFVRMYDVNGDGIPDIVTGPNTLAAGGSKGQTGDYPYGGLQWYEAPKEDRHNLANWKRHQINGSYIGSTYGFERADVNGDGFMDFVVVDADSDFGGTKPGEQKVVWFENPGDGKPAQNDPWPMHVIYFPHQEVFDVKPHLGVGDLNGDGLPDVAVQTRQDDLLVFLNRDRGDKWEEVRIHKPHMTNWKSRFTTITDVDGDGHNDILCALSRHDWKGGSIDQDRAAIFWMKCENGNDVRADNWITYPIKRGSGPLDNDKRGKEKSGEKWNRLYNVDLDGDGDRDIIANCEEYQNSHLQSALSVQWFEAPFANDREAPTVPQGLQVSATPTGAHLQWQASTDRVGVAGYKIYRDHAYVGYVNTFNGEVLTYDDVVTGSHGYAVAAYDAAANTSAPCAEQRAADH